MQHLARALNWTLLSAVALVSLRAEAKLIPLTLERLHSWSDYMVVANVDQIRVDGNYVVARLDIAQCYGMHGSCKLRKNEDVVLFDNTSTEHGKISVGSKYLIFIDQCRDKSLTITTPNAFASLTGSDELIQAGSLGLTQSIQYKDLELKMNLLRSRRTNKDRSFQCSAART